MAAAGSLAAGPARDSPLIRPAPARPVPRRAAGTGCAAGTRRPDAAEAAAGSGTAASRRRRRSASTAVCTCATRPAERIGTTVPTSRDPASVPRVGAPTSARHAGAFRAPDHDLALGPQVKPTLRRPPDQSRSAFVVGAPSSNLPIDAHQINLRPTIARCPS